MTWLAGWEHLVAGRQVDEISMQTTRDATSITYEVVIGLADSFVSDGGVRAWIESVTFGATDATCAGGAAFRLAAREQERVAEELWHRFTREERR